ncbi:MAG: caspase family protein [Crocinitomicaceae bacterium]
MKVKLFIISVLFSLGLFAQQKEVEVVISSGWTIAQCSAISSNNQYTGQAMQNAASVWDVKTGRMIRNVVYTEDFSAALDSIWFNEDNTKLIVGFMMSNDRYEIDIASGEVVFIKGAPYDFSNYQYRPSNFQKINIYLYNQEKDDLTFRSPDGNAILIYHKIKNPLRNTSLQPFSYEVRLKIGKENPFSIDTTVHGGFVFSEDSRLLMVNKNIYDLQSGRKISDLRMVPFSGWSAMFLPDSRVPVTAAIGSIRIWDFPDVQDIKIPDLVDFRQSAVGDVVVCEVFSMLKKEKVFVAVNLLTKKIAVDFFSSEKSGYLQDVSASGERYCFMEMEKENAESMETKYTIKVIDRKSADLISDIPGSTKAFFTLNEDELLVDEKGVGTFKYHLQTKEKIPFPTEGLNETDVILAVSNDHKYIFGNKYVTGNEGTPKSIAAVWEMESGSLIFEKELSGYNLTAFQSSKDGQLLAVGSTYENAIYVFNLQTKKQLHRLIGHTAYIRRLAFSDDGKRLISSAIDGTRRIWNLEEGTEMVSLINTGEKDYAIVTPQQYYYATKGAKKMIHFVKGKEIYPFSQFDLKYNRPDIIIRDMEASNQALQQPFYYAYQKRLKRLGFTEEMLDGSFHMPIADIANDSELPISTTEKNIHLNVHAADPRFLLDRLIVRVNEVPVEGKLGTSLKGSKLHVFQKTIPVELSQGKNRIEVSVMNEKGVESIASHVSIEYLPKEIKRANFYLFAIGVSSYEQAEYNLSYAAKDAKDLAALFETNSTTFGRVHVTQITNEQVTLEGVKALRKELEKTEVDDAVCVFFAGHGLLDVELNYYLAAHPINFKNPAENGIPYEVLEDLLDGIPARKKLIMIDACHSGEIDKEEIALVESTKAGQVSDEITFRAVTSTTLQRVGLNNSFELMKELFTDIRKASGTMIISSAGGMEYAMEGGEWKNGVFTYSFLKGIKSKEADLNADGMIMLSEMNTYIRNKVFELTKGRQQPTNRAEVVESDWRIW